MYVYHGLRCMVRHLRRREKGGHKGVGHTGLKTFLDPKLILQETGLTPPGVPWPRLIAAQGAAASLQPPGPCSGHPGGPAEGWLDHRIPGAHMGFPGPSFPDAGVSQASALPPPPPLPSCFGPGDPPAVCLGAASW